MLCSEKIVKYPLRCWQKGGPSWFWLMRVRPVFERRWQGNTLRGFLYIPMLVAVIWLCGCGRYNLVYEPWQLWVYGINSYQIRHWKVPITEIQISGSVCEKLLLDGYWWHICLVHRGGYKKHAVFNFSIMRYIQARLLSIYIAYWDVTWISRTLYLKSGYSNYVRRRIWVASQDRHLVPRRDSDSPSYIVWVTGFQV